MWRVIEVKLIQLQKASQPMFLTDLGMVIEVKLTQLLKAVVLMEMTEKGISTDFNLLNSRNALSPIEDHPK